MPENENTLDDTLAQALKLLDGDSAAEVVAEPEKKVDEVVPEVIPETPKEETPETTEQVEPEEKEEPENEADKLPHGESSRLGRKVKRIEDTFAEAMSKIDALTAAIGKSSIVTPVPEVDDEMPEIITTSEDVQKVIDIRDRKKQMEAQREKDAYFGQFATHKSEEMYDEVYQEMLKSHNVKVTGKPEIDADINFLKAKNAILSRKLAETAKPRPNSLGKTPPAVNVPSVSPVMAKALNLTADEQNAAATFGFNEEELHRIFSK